jgi:uncharacterized protein
MTFPFGVPASLEKKCNGLEKVLSPHGPICLAYSGGVDSSFLAWFIRHVLKMEFTAFLVVSPFISRREHRNALQVAEEIGMSPEEIVLDVLGVEAVRDNPAQRCYFCKTEIISRIEKRARDLKCSLLVDGTNAGDRKVHRPGHKALQELGVLSPLALAGLEKAEIRELSRLAGLSTWNKPSQSCLATRIPYGTPLTLELLSRVEQAEAILWDLGCEQVRVRVHGTDLARIEVNPEAFGILLQEEARNRVARHLRELGFLHVTLDLAGFRSGCWDERTN